MKYESKKTGKLWNVLVEDKTHGCLLEGPGKGFHGYNAKIWFSWAEIGERFDRYEEPIVVTKFKLVNLDTFNTYSVNFPHDLETAKQNRERRAAPEIYVVVEYTKTTHKGKTTLEIKVHD